MDNYNLIYRRRFFCVLQPLKGTFVKSRMLEILMLFLNRPRITLFLYLLWPRNSSAVVSIRFWRKSRLIFEPKLKFETCVDFLEPVKPLLPQLFQKIVFPFVSETVAIVLLGVKKKWLILLFGVINFFFNCLFFFGRPGFLNLCY